MPVPLEANKVEAFPCSCGLESKMANVYGKDGTSLEHQHMTILSFASVFLGTFALLDELSKLHGR